MIEPRLRREVASAYLATAMRSAAWIGVTAMLIRSAGRPAYATLTLLSTTIALLEYIALGLGPAIIRVTAQRLAAARAGHPSDENSSAAVLREVYASGLAMALLSAAAGGILLIISIVLLRNHDGVVLQLCALLGIATLLRTTSDALGATLQTQRKIHRDNLLIALGEALWLLFTAAALLTRHVPWQFATGGSLVLAAALLLVFRTAVAARLPGGFYHRWPAAVRREVVWQLLLVGFMLTAAQMADFLYSPTDNLIIANCINRNTVADYNPAVQVDSGLLLLAAAVASVLLPRSALAHAAGDGPAVRRYYIRGTLFSAAILLAAAPITLYLAPWAFHLWLARDTPLTLHILPFMLIHTILGGSSAVGRAVLIAVGRIRPLVISVLVAGIANVLLSFAFVRYGHMGLTGIVLGTIIAVTGRCAIWMPWYTLRALRQTQPDSERAGHRQGDEK